MKISIITTLLGSLLIASATMQAPNQFITVPTSTAQAISNQARCQSALEAYFASNAPAIPAAPKKNSGVKTNISSAPSKAINVTIATIPPQGTSVPNNSNTTPSNISTQTKAFLANPDTYTYQAISSHKLLVSLMILSAILLAAIIKYETQIVSFLTNAFRSVFSKKKSATITVPTSTPGEPSQSPIQSITGSNQHP